MGKGIINTFDHMEFRIAINLTMCGNLVVTWPSVIAAGYVSIVK